MTLSSSRPRPRWLRGVTTGAALVGMLGLIGAVTRAQSLPAVTLAASASNAKTGQTIIFTAHAQQVTNPEYEWWVEAPGGAWQQVTPSYSYNNTYTLTDVQPGSYLVKATVDAASAISQGHTAPEATSAVSTLLVGSQLTLTASAATITPGQPLTLTATAHQVSQPVYQFWVRNPAGVWSSSGGFTRTATYAVTPHTVGTYLFIAYTEPAGSAMPHPLPSAVVSIGSQPTMFLNGPTVPTTAIGVKGDMYLDTATETLYGPKTPTGWGSPVGLVGPRGPAGPQDRKGVRARTVRTASTALMARTASAPVPARSRWVGRRTPAWRVRSPKSTTGPQPPWSFRGPAPGGLRSVEIPR